MASYYIAQTGLTTNSGTSPASPWSLSKVGSFAFSAGDNILFRCGDIFSGTTSFSHSGSAGSPITFDLYGCGVNPILDGAGSTTNSPLQINGSYITINNLILQNNKYKEGILYLTNNTHDITIYNCYLNNGNRGINAVLCGTGGVANLLIDSNYFTNFADNTGHTNGGGSHIQLNNCYGSGIEIRNNFCYTPIIVSTTDPNNANLGVGDIISIYQSSGTSVSNILVHDNKIRGGSSYSGGLAGMILGDVGGQYQYGYNNLIANGGFAGAQIVGGDNINFSNNTIYGDQLSYNMQGLTFGYFGGEPNPPTNITAGNNKMNVIDKYGNAYSWFISPPLATPTNWSTNTPQFSTDPTVTNAILPDPLWTGSPWNLFKTKISLSR